MADIKLREVNRGHIKTMDHSIAASNRIRNAASEIKTQSRRQLQDNESSPNEYASGQVEYGMQESAYIARQAAARAAPKVKDGTQKAIQSYRIRHARSQIKRQRANSGRAEGASSSSIKLRQLAQAKAKSNQAVAAFQTQKRMQQTAIRTAKAAKQSVKTTKQAVLVMLRAARAAAEGAKALITVIIAGGWAAVAVVLCCVIFGAAFYFFGDESSQSYTPVSPEVEAYTPVIQKYANEYGIGEYTDLIKAVMMQESGGRGKDPMQSSECGFNKKYPNKPNAIKDPDYSINCGVQMLASVLKSAKCSSPVDMDHIKLALQGYNFGGGYITWAFDKYGGYSKANAIEFSKLQAKKAGISSYGDTEYVEHVLRYYPYGNYSYDVIFTGPGKLGLPIKGMTKNNISSHFGPRSSPGGIGSTNHQGLDIAFPSGTKVLACESGKVTKAGWYSGYGLCVIIDHGKGVQTIYAHLSKVNAKKGQVVVRGQYIGNVGSTGNSTGPHLHLGVMLRGSFVNPEKGWLSIP